jgi:hypothetical protein
VRLCEEFVMELQVEVVCREKAPFGMTGSRTEKAEEKKCKSGRVKE